MTSTPPGTFPATAPSGLVYALKRAMVATGLVAGDTAYQLAQAVAAHVNAQPAQPSVTPQPNPTDTTAAVALTDLEVWLSQVVTTRLHTLATTYNHSEALDLLADLRTHLTGRTQ